MRKASGSSWTNQMYVSVAGSFKSGWAKQISRNFPPTDLYSAYFTKKKGKKF
jgi:hypothetical protein